MKKFENWLQEQENVMPAEAGASGENANASNEDAEVQGLNQQVRIYMGKLIEAMNKQSWTPAKRIDFIVNMLHEMSASMGLSMPQVSRAMMQYRQMQ